MLLEDAIDRDTYTTKRDELRQDLALAEANLEQARHEQLDVEAITAFAEDVLTDVAGLWERASLKHKQRLQSVLFPEGLVFERGGKGQSGGFRTPVTGLAFKTFAAFSEGKSTLASPTRFELVLPP